MSGGRWCLGLAWWAVKITIITFITPADCLEVGGFGDGGTRGTKLLRHPHLQTSDNFHYRKVMAQGGRDLISQTILAHPLLYHFHGVLDFRDRYSIETVQLGFHWFERHHMAQVRGLKVVFP